MAGKNMGRAPLMSAPAPMCKSSGLEAELQTELNETGIAHRAGDNAEVPIVRYATSSVRRTEGWAVKEVEELGAELQVHALTEPEVLEGSPVPVGEAVLTKRGVHSRLVAERPG